MGLYEIDLAARLELSTNNDDLIYTKPATDPYSNSNPGSLLSENQANLDSVLLGDANYDVGHVFSTGGGGLAGLGVIGITGQKAWGETGASQPTGDYFWVDYVAHELVTSSAATTLRRQPGELQDSGLRHGHGTGERHHDPGVRRDLRERRPRDCAFPGGASDPNFHAISFDEIQDTMDNIGRGAPSPARAIPSQPVTSVGGSSFTIPQRTPLVLAAHGNDADAGDVLTYSWEQMDAASARPLTSTSKGVAAAARTRRPRRRSATSPSCRRSSPATRRRPPARAPASPVDCRAGPSTCRRQLAR